MVRECPELDAVDVVTDPSEHHNVVCQALDLGLHVMVEKPMAISVRACHMMIEAADRNGKVLSVAENYRRDPSARLVRHLLENRAIGDPYLALFHQIMPGNEIFITPWRHLKDRGGPLLDLGVHFADLVRYQLGDIAEVYGDVRLVEPVRRRPDSESMEYSFYQRRFQEMETQVPADAEDTSAALFRMANGMTLSWLVGMGGHGRCGAQMILGTEGCIDGFGTRGGQVALRRASREEIGQEGLIDGAAGFELDPLAEHLFPSAISDRDGQVDWKILALEFHELARAILDGQTVEVDGVEGMKDVAATYAVFESARAGRAVSMDEVEACRAYDYQAEIDETLGIGP